MFVAFMPLHILLCDEVLLYFILWVGDVQSSNLFWIQIYLQTIKVLKYRKALLCIWAKISPGLAFFFSRDPAVSPAPAQSPHAWPRALV
jgi:hypothetical protein